MYVRIIEMNCKGADGFRFRLKDPSHGHLFVRFTTAAYVLTKEGYKNASAGDFIIYRAEEEMAYGARDKKFVHDYFRFYLDKEEEDLLDLPTGMLLPSPLPKKLDEIFRLMMLEYYSNSENRDKSLMLFGRLFLLGIKDLFSEKKTPLPKKNREELVRIRTEMLSSPEKEWTVELLSEKAHLSPSYFQALYKKSFGISPVNDLIEARIKKAESILLCTTLKEDETARRSGYKNVEHFIRQFKKLRGITPSEFRREKQDKKSLASFENVK